MSIGGPAPVAHRFAAALARELSDGSVLSRAQVVAVSKEQLSEIPVLIAGRSNSPRARAVTTGRFARAGADREPRPSQRWRPPRRRDGAGGDAGGSLIVLTALDLNRDDLVRCAEMIRGHHKVAMVASVSNQASQSGVNVEIDAAGVRATLHPFGIEFEPAQRRVEPVLQPTTDSSCDVSQSFLPRHCDADASLVATSRPLGSGGRVVACEPRAPAGAGLTEDRLRWRDPPPVDDRLASIPPQFLQWLQANGRIPVSGRRPPVTLQRPPKGPVATLTAAAPTDADTVHAGERRALARQPATRATLTARTPSPASDGAEPREAAKLDGERTERETSSPPVPELVVKVLGVPCVAGRPQLSRREVMLTVYLACRGGQVNASAIQDVLWNGRAVQGKTVWNLVAKTRRALGRLPDGSWILPPADRNRRMKGLADGVTTDLEMLGWFCEQAQCVSSSEAMGLLRRGLALVEGPPFDADGYDWAHHGTQHVAEACHLIEQATAQLVELALDADDVELAREAITQGLRGLPGDEALYRLRMRVEHRAGKPGGVLAAYNELVLHLDEFAAEPAPATLQLRRELLGRRSP